MKQSYVTHLEAALDGTRYPARQVQTVHEGRPLWVRYDLPAVKAAVSRDDLAHRPHDLWRYRELLPVDDDAAITSLGESMTPLLACPRLGAAVGVPGLLIKDESSLPTGSFKARGMAMAVSMARQFGLTRLAIPTAGNAGGALAAYAARAGMEAFVFMPDDTPVVNRAEAALFGARAFLVDGLINDCGAIVREGAGPMGWFDVSTLKEPYRLEGKKTMGLELAEQLDWTLPDAILYPTGGGTGLVGMWKAFDELEALGWLEDTRRPRMYACQSTGCDPLPRAWAAGERFGQPVEAPATAASGLRVPVACGDFMVLDAVAASGGAALAAPDSEIAGMMALAAESEGISLCPEAAIALAVLRRAVSEGTIEAHERVVLFNTGAAQKYLELIDHPLPRFDKDRMDWDRIRSRGASKD